MTDLTSNPLDDSSSVRLATHLSNILQPGLITYLALIALLIPVSAGFAHFMLLYTVSATGMVTLPTLYVLWLLHTGRITHLFLPIRQQRTSVYLFTVCSCLLTYPLLRYLNVPAQISYFTLATAVNTLVVLLINLSWKISGHTFGLTSALVVLSVSFGWTSAPLYLLVPIVAWARVVVRAHTPAQVIGGSLLGFGLTWLQLSWLLPRLTFI